MQTTVKNDPSTIDLDQALAVGLRACRLGREVLLKYIGHLEHVSEKFQAGLVSEADKESERVITDHLRKNFPGIEVLGEESSYEQKSASPDLAAKRMTPAGAQGRWILDPLDGTTNYVHQFSVFCISLGLEVNGRIQVAIIDCPKLGETYTAIRGQGAKMNGRPIHVSSTVGLKDSLLATGFVAEHEHVIAEQLKIFSDVVRKCRGVRRAGAAAYDLALVARGVFDGYWERNIQPWDAAAGILLVEEAGGKICTYKGQEYHPYKNSIVAGSPHVVGELLTCIAPLVAAQTD